MQARMRNPAVVLPDTMQAVNALYKAVHTAGVPKQALELVHLRASQINGCSPCVDGGSSVLSQQGLQHRFQSVPGDLDADAQKHE